MKTLATIFAIVVFALGSGTTDKLAEPAEKMIAHEELATPAEFGFGHQFYLDIDKDGKSDFMFTTLFINENDGIHTKYLVNTLGENEVLAVDNEAAVADNGNPLEDFGNITWKNAPVNILEQVDNGETNTWTGLWSGDRDQYIGIKLVKGDNTYTGWVQVNIDQTNEQAQVEGYAINRVPDSLINAGEL